MDKDLVKRVVESEEIQISSKANILSEQKYKLSYPLFQQMMYKSCEQLLDKMREQSQLTMAQLKLLAANLQEKVVMKVCAWETRGGEYCLSIPTSITHLLPGDDISKQVEIYFFLGHVMTKGFKSPWPVTIGTKCLEYIST